MSARTNVFAALASLFAVVAPAAAPADPASPPLGLASWLDDARTEELPDAQLRQWAKRRRDLEIARDRFGRRAAREAKDSAARTILVRVLALLGEHDRVAAELEPVLRADLPRWLDLVRSHEDLATFRASPAGVALLTRIAELEREWRAALQRGLPVVARIESSWRPGVLSEDGARFVPAAPAWPHGIGGIYDARRERALVVTGLPVKGTVAEAALRVHDWADGTTRTLRWDAMDDYVHAVSTADGVFVRETHHRDALERPHWGVFARLEADGRTTPAPDAARIGPSISFWGSGGSWSQPEPPAGWQLEGRTLRGPNGVSIELPAEHAGAFIPTSIAASPDGRALYVATVRSDVTPSRPRAPYLLTRVDLSTQRPEILYRGHGGSIAAVFGPGGALYVQNARRSFRLDQATGVTVPLRPGVYLTYDLFWRGAVDMTFSWAAHFREAR